jgi:hypothetical protein
MTDYLAIARECGLDVSYLTRWEDDEVIHTDTVSGTGAALSAFAERVQRHINLSDYINAAHINGSDAPHVVVEKLQAAIDAAMAQQVPERAE